MVEKVRSEQVGIAERLAVLQDKPAAPVVMAPPPAGSGLRTTHTVYFPLGAISGSVIDEQIAKLLAPVRDRLAEAAAKDTCRIDVSGFSDTLGNDNANLKLSQDRADYVAAKLRTEGLTVSHVKGWGERRLKIHTLDATKNELNRRVEVETWCEGVRKAKADVAS